MSEKLRLVALISGRGSNLRALIERAKGDFPARVVAVISNEPDAPGLEYARHADIPTELVAHRCYADRTAFEHRLAEVIDGYRPGLLVLAGFMRVLTRGFVERYAGRIINIHPSLLPAFPGLRTHERALEAGVSEHGATVHFVTPELDAGPVIIQARVPVWPGDDAETLAARVLEQEHRIYPEAVRIVAERLRNA